jgi:phosphoribosyl 1,2-cyclic phosphate phosphodiesterase
MRRRIPVYADHATGEMLGMRFGYCFHTPAGSDYPPILTEHRIEAGVPVAIDGPGGVLTGLPFTLQHGQSEALGFRFGDFAYINDVSAVPEATMPVLAGLRVAIVDALRHTPHPTHFSVSEALAFIDRIRPRHAVLTNMHTDIDYADLSARLPPNVEPAYDGMQLVLPLTSS